MKKTKLLSVIIGAVIALSYAFVAPNPFLAGAVQVNAQGTSGQGQYATVNGLKMYYETYGTGQPLILLHGGLDGIFDFAALIPPLAKTRQVIAVELQGHGHTADIDRPLSYEAMADDIAALIKQLGLGKADLLGYSVGGEVALQTVIRHPELVRKVVLVSTAYKRDGWYPDTLAQEAAMNDPATAKAMMQSPIYQYYAKVAPKPEDWPKLVTKLGDLLRKDYDWSKEVAAIKTPTLVVVGDNDRVQPMHAVKMVGLLGGVKMDGGVDIFSNPQGALPTAQLAVLPGTTHFTIEARADLLLPIINPFLDSAVPASS